MAGTVTTDLVFFSGATGGTSNCDSLTDWTGTGLVVDTVAFVQGTGSIYTYSAASTTQRLADFACVSTDIQNKVIYFWYALGKVGWLNTKANGGLRVRVEDASANYGEWYVAGSDTLPHNGFICHAVHTSQAFDAQSATPPNKAAITKICIRAYGSFPGKAYTWVDAVRIGTGVTIKGGTESSPATFQDIIDAEETVSNKWGVLSKVEGILFAQGLLNFGSTTAGEATYFKDTNQVLIFKSALVPSDFFEIKLQGNATATTKIYFGTKSGEAGISGCVFRSGGAAKFKFTATDPYITNLGIYGCSFFDANTISLPSYSTNKEVLNTTFEMGAEVLADTCIVKNCNFISSDDAPVRALRISSTSHHVTDSKFIGCPRAINIPNAGTYSFSNLVFSGNTYDIENSSTGTVIINASGTSNPSTYINTNGGTTVIYNTKTLKITVLDSANQPIEGAQVWIQKMPEDSSYGHEGNPFTSAAGNNQGDGDFVVNEALPSDLPSSGWLMVQDYDTNKVQSYRYASLSSTTKTFTLRSEVTGTDNGTGTETTINETGIGSKDIVEGDTIRNTTDNQWAIVLSVSANSVTTTPLSGGASWAGDNYSVHRLALNYDANIDTATVPLMNKETDSNGIATEDYNYGGDKNVIVRVRKASGGTNYLPLSTSQQITDNGLNLTVTLTKDTVKS